MSYQTNISDMDALAADKLRSTLQAIEQGDVAGLKEGERAIRLALQRNFMSDYHQVCITALLGLLTDDWYEAEKIRIEVAQAYLVLRSNAAVSKPSMLSTISNELRGLLINKLNAKQETNAPAHGLLGVKFDNEDEARAAFAENTGLGPLFDELKIYPERHTDHDVIRNQIEARARAKTGPSHCPFEIMPFSSNLARKQKSNDDNTDKHTTEHETPHQMTEAEIQRKRAKNRKKNQSRKAIKKAKKAEAETHKTASDELADSFANDLKLSPAETKSLEIDHDNESDLKEDGKGDDGEKEKDLDAYRRCIV